MTTVATLVINLSGKMVKSTTAQYQREQAMLLAKSYTEYAIMAISANDRNATGNCLTDINGHNIIFNELQGGYRARVRISYIGHASEVNNCSATRVFSNSVTTATTPLNAIIDVYIDYKELDQVTSSIAPWITYHKRTLQKI